MIIYLINCIITAVLGLIAEICIIKDKHKKNINFYVGFITFILLIIWSLIYALRGEYVGSDTSGYMYFYNRLGNSTITFSEYLSQGGDVLFESLRYFCNRVTDNNWVFFAFASAILTYLPSLKAMIKENGKYIFMTLLLYIFTMIYYSGFNAVRQSIAVSITFYAYIFFFKEKKYIKYFAFILLAYGFHSTALFVIPFHFMSRLSIKSKKLWAIVLLLFFSSLFFQSLWNTVISFFSIIGNDTLALRYANNTYSGSGYLRIAVILVPIVLGLWKYNILIKDDSSIDSFIILSILCAIFMLYSTNNWLFARLASYFMPFLVVYIPRLIIVFTPKSRKIAVLLISSLYFCYMLMLLLHGESNLYPYSFY